MSGMPPSGRDWPPQPLWPPPRGEPRPQDPRAPGGNGNPSAPQHPWRSPTPNWPAPNGPAPSQPLPNGPAPQGPGRWGGAERPLPDLAAVDVDTRRAPEPAPPSQPALPGRALADVETVPQRATRRPGRWEQRRLADEPTARLVAHRNSTHPAPPSVGRWQGARRLPPWATRLALTLALVLLGVRAGFASAQFMLPGGDIVGWSQPPQVVCALCGIVPTPSQHELTPKEYAAILAQRLSLDDALGQMIMIQFYTSDVTPDLIQMITTQRVGGALLLGRPVLPADQTLNPQLQKLASIPMLVAIDQEGGSVNRFRTIAGSLPGAGSLADPAAARARGEQDGNLLRTYGYNLNFAPMVDLGIPNPVDQFIGRTFGEDPTRVAAMAGAYLQGLQETGQVIGVLKHFPGGLVETGADPHIVMPVLNRSRADWEANDLAPYRTLLAQGNVSAIMVSHEIIPSVDAQLPTSLSPTIINGTLRGELGFDGVVVTDDLHMRALNTQWSVWDAGVLAVKAGADIVGEMATPFEVQSTLDALKQAVSSGQITRARIDDSVRRILTLKLQLGLISMPNQSTQRRNYTGPPPGLAQIAPPVARMSQWAWRAGASG